MNLLCLISGILACQVYLIAAEPEEADFSPPSIQAQIEQLRAAELTDRQKAGAFLSQWAAKEPQQAKKLFLSLLRESEDPEIRERSLQLLKPIAALEFGSFGEGYLGITMGNEIAVKLPNDEKPCYGLIVSVVTKQSAADAAKIQVGDVIVAVNDQKWRGPLTTLDEKNGLSATIRSTGAGNRARFSIWRNNALLEQEATLSRRPGNLELLQMQLMPNGGVGLDEAELRKMVEEEKNSRTYFSEWLNRQSPPSTQKK